MLWLMGEGDKGRAGCRASGSGVQVVGQPDNGMPAAMDV